MDLSKGTVADVRSSVVFQILLLFDAWYFAAFVLLELLIFTYKGVVLPYRSGDFVMELFLLAFLAVVEATRNFMGQKGNLTEHNLAVVISLALTAPTTIGIVYFLLWQTYILRVEVILTSIQLTFYAFQLIMAVFCIVNFSR